MVLQNELVRIRAASRREIKPTQALISFLNISMRRFGASPSSERLESSRIIDASMMNGRTSVAIKKYELCDERSG
jgi:hypothetical protein